MSKRDRRDGDRHGDRRESQPEDDFQGRTSENEGQDSDSLVALKAILSKVAALLKPLQLTSEESIRLVEQLYSKVLETDLQFAAEADDARKSSVLAAIQNATIRRESDRLVVEYCAASLDTQGVPGGAATPIPRESEPEKVVPAARPAVPPATPAPPAGVPTALPATEEPSAPGSETTAPARPPAARRTGVRRTAAAKPSSDNGQPAKGQDLHLDAQ